MHPHTSLPRSCQEFPSFWQRSRHTCPISPHRWNTVTHLNVLLHNVNCVYIVKALCSAPRSTKAQVKWITALHNIEGDTHESCTYNSCFFLVSRKSNFGNLFAVTELCDCMLMVICVRIYSLITEEPCQKTWPLDKLLDSSLAWHHTNSF